jgi:hypothetical protein
VTATRRLAAVHAVDIVGYSRLMDEDERGSSLISLKSGIFSCSYLHEWNADEAWVQRQHRFGPSRTPGTQTSDAT